MLLSQDQKDEETAYQYRSVRAGYEEIGHRNSKFKALSSTSFAYQRSLIPSASSSLPPTFPQPQQFPHALSLYLLDQSLQA
jgi:hypothetical protein